MGFPNAPRANLGAWSSPLPVLKSSPKPAAARRNAWSRPAPWANFNRKAVPLPKQEASLVGVVIAAPDRAPSASPSQASMKTSPRESEPAFVSVVDEVAAPERAAGPAEEARHSWTVKVEEVGWFDNEEVITVAPNRAPDSQPALQFKPFARTRSNPSSRENSGRGWTTVGSRQAHSPHGHAHSPHGQSHHNRGPPRGYGRQQTRYDRPAHNFRSVNVRSPVQSGKIGRGVWRKKGCEEEPTSRAVSPTPSPGPRSPCATPPPFDIVRTESASSAYSSSSTMSEARTFSPRPSVHENDPQISAIVKKMEKLGSNSSAWADEDDDMEW